MQGFVKICGLTEKAGLCAALDAGADFLGFVFRPESPRNLSFDKGAELVRYGAATARRVAVTADADNDFLDMLVEKVRPDVLQLHGGETPRRAAELAGRFNIAVFKTLGISHAGDLAALQPYEAICEKIVLEAKMPDGKPYGGSGRCLDWSLLRQISRREHIMLAGGLKPENVGEAIFMTGVGAVDVSSGIEKAPGLKDIEKIQKFIAAARGAFAQNGRQTA